VKIIVFGGCNIDIVGQTTRAFQHETSNPGRVEIVTGGVGRNVAHFLASLGHDVELVTVISESFFGELTEASLFRSGIGFEFSRKLDVEDSFYLAMEDENGELIGAVNQMDNIERLDAEYVNACLRNIHKVDMIVIDTNLHVDTIKAIAESKGSIPLAVEAVSIEKVQKIRGILPMIDVLKVNEMEARALSSKENDFEILKDLLQLGVQEIHMTLGAKGSMSISKIGISHYPVDQIERVKSVNQVGDAYFAGIIHGYLMGLDSEKKMAFAAEMARKRLMGGI
jgi:pseudouridine kinase